jgi:hypothetical protein
MRAIIYKSALALHTDPYAHGILAGAPISLALSQDGSISASVESGRRGFFRLGSPRSIVLGTLEHTASAILRPALKRNVHLRVRIVEVEPPHISSCGETSVYISVWGNPDDFEPPIDESPVEKARIFNPTKIND